jgi:hypothetical protein
LQVVWPSRFHANSLSKGHRLVILKLKARCPLDFFPKRKPAAGIVQKASDKSLARRPNINIRQNPPDLLVLMD